MMTQYIVGDKMETTYSAQKFDKSSCDKPLLITLFNKISNLVFLNFLTTPNLHYINNENFKNNM